MQPTVTGEPERASWRSRYRALAGAPRRSEATAALAAAVLLTQVLLAQATLLLTACLLAAGRASRWRPAWLAVPAAAGLVWVLAIGPGRAWAGFTAGASQLVWHLTGPRGGLGRLLARPSGAFSGWAGWLPRQLPLALLAAAAETALLSVPRWRAGRAGYRPGLIAAARSRYVDWSAGRGETATGDGGTLGVDQATGSRLAISWREAGHGVLIAGRDAASLAGSGLALATAAIHRRKAVVVIDLAGDADLAAGILTACRMAAAPLRRYGAAVGCYEPLLEADPAQAAALVLSMIDWGGLSMQRRHFCAEYLTAAAAVCAATAPPDGPPGEGLPGERLARGGLPGKRLPGDGLPGLRGLATSLLPGELRLRLDLVPDYWPARAALTERTAQLARLADADPGAVAMLASQLARLCGSALGQWLVPAGHMQQEQQQWRSGLGRGTPQPGSERAGQPARRGAAGAALRAGPPAGTAISIGRALRQREVILFSLDRRANGRAATMIARLAAADLTAALSDRAALGAPADCLAWIHGCEALDPRQLARLTALGPAAGTAVLVSTSVTAAAAGLAAAAGVVVLRGSVPAELGGLAAERAPAGQSRPAAVPVSGQPDTLALIVRGPAARTRHGRAVQARALPGSPR